MPYDRMGGMKPIDRVVVALGGRKVFREKLADYTAVIARGRQGLSYASLEAVAARYEIPVATLVRVLHIPARTLARRKKERKLHPDESDRVLRLARVAALAEETLGTREKAASWLRGSIRALGDVSPLDMLDSDVGAREVERILGRIAHGVYS
jgi:putative toxin-antitoxin system antitoxin component (TIGR02293 family)